MKRKAIMMAVLVVCLGLIWGCGPIRKPLDQRTGFSKGLKEIETHIREGMWKEALGELEQAQKTWKRIKPLLQLDIDHDYINDMENNFVRLKGYLEAKDISNSLATILLIQETWKDIGQM